MRTVADEKAKRDGTERFGIPDFGLLPLKSSHTEIPDHQKIGAGLGEDGQNGTFTRKIIVWPDSDLYFCGYRMLHGYIQTI